MIKKRIEQAALALSLLGAASTLCIKGMKKIGDKISERKAIEDRNSYRKK